MERVPSPSARVKMTLAPSPSALIPPAAAIASSTVAPRTSARVPGRLTCPVATTWIAVEGTTTTCPARARGLALMLPSKIRRSSASSKVSLSSTFPPSYTLTAPMSAHSVGPPAAAMTSIRVDPGSIEYEPGRLTSPSKVMRSRAPGTKSTSPSTRPGASLWGTCPLNIPSISIWRTSESSSDLRVRETLLPSPSWRTPPAATMASSAVAPRSSSIWPGLPTYPAT